MWKYTVRWIMIVWVILLTVVPTSDSGNVELDFVQSLHYKVRPESHYKANSRPVKKFKKVA